MSYVVEYAQSDQSSCSGPKNMCPSKEKTINKDELRLGIQIQQIHGISWRHWTCTTPKVFKNIKVTIEKPEDLEGFNELREDDKERIIRAWKDGRIPLNERPEKPEPQIKKKSVSSTVTRTTKSTFTNTSKPEKKKPPAKKRRITHIKDKSFKRVKKQD